MLVANDGRDSIFYFMPLCIVKSLKNWLKDHIDVNDQGMLSELPP